MDCRIDPNEGKGGESGEEKEEREPWRLLLVGNSIDIFYFGLFDGANFSQILMEFRTF